MPYELEAQTPELTPEQMEEVAGGLDTQGAGALQNVGATNSLIGLLLPAVQKVR